MKRNISGMKRALAVLLCFMLVLGGTGTPAYAGEAGPAQTDAEGTFDSAVPVSASEGDSEENAGYSDREQPAISENGGTSAEDGEAAVEDSKAAAHDEAATEDSETAVEDSEAAVEDSEAAVEDSEAAVEDESAAGPADVIEDAAEGTDDANTAAAASESEPADNGEDTIITDPSVSEICTDVRFVRRSWNEEKGKVEAEDKTAASINAVPGDGGMTRGWYYLNRNVTVKDRVNLTGNTDLILGDGYTLDVRGIYVPKGSTLTIYGQSDGEAAGKIISHPGTGAGIGAISNNRLGGNVVIHGGWIEAEGADHCAGIGGDDGNEKDIGDFTMYGGTVTAKGGESGAGIGGGRAGEGGKITIYDGTVKATGGHYGAGIGGGDGQDKNPMRGAHAGTITIWGGTVTAKGGDDGAGIGGGEGGNAGTITIHGGTVTATGGNNSAGIGCGEGESTGRGGTVTIHGGTVNATGGGDGAGIGGGDSSGDNGTCDKIIIDGGTVTATGGGNGAGIGGGNNADGGEITISGKSTEVYAYYSDGAGIGGGEDGDGGKITISDGYVYIESKGNGNGAGIGGGNHSGNGGTINIKGGELIINSDHGAGIGGGRQDDNMQWHGEPNSGSGGTITISGGKVTVTSDGGFGIGAGAHDGDGYIDEYHPGASAIGSAGTITISGERTQVNAGGYLAGVGGDSGTIRVEGGGLAAYGVNGSGTGIWLMSSNDGKLYVSGGKLEASASYEGCSGIYLDGGELKITGGEVIAKSEQKYGIYAGKVTVEGEGTRLEARGYLKSAVEMSGSGKLAVTKMAEVVLVTGTDDSPAEEPVKSPGMTVYTEAAVEYTENYADVDSGGEISRCLNTERESVKTSKTGYQYIRVFPCDHSHKYYVITNDTHRENCPDCDKAYEEQNHLPDPFNKCSICGFQDTIYSVMFFKGNENAGGEMAALKLLPGTRFVLPECDFTAPIGMRFRTWSVSLSGGEIAEMPPGSMWIMNVDIKLTAVWEKIPTVTVNGVTGSFNDRIKLNYYFDIPGDLLTDAGAYVTITNERSGRSVELPVKDAVFVENRGYKFSIPMAAKEAGDLVCAKMFDGSDCEVPIFGKSGADYTRTGVYYTLMEYFTWLEEKGDNEKEKAVGAAARDYCSAAQIYFDYYAEGVTVSEAVSGMSDDLLSDLDSYIAVRSDTGLPDGVKIKGISAMLESDNTLRLYFEYSGEEAGSEEDEEGPGGLAFMIDGSKANATSRTDGACYLALDTGVWSNHLQDEHVYSISDGTNTYTIKASVLTYARSCAFKKGTTDEVINVRNIGKALYLYNLAAVAAFGK